MIKKLISLVILTFSFTALSESDDVVMEYVESLIKETFAILKDESLSVDQKIEYSEKLIRNNMDLKWVSKFLLGRHRRTLTKEQVEDFSKLYSEYIVKTYSSAVKNFKDQELEVKRQKKINSTDYAVKTLLIAPDADPLRIEYMIRRMNDGSFKIFDVVTEGVSLINSHQAEFSSTLMNENFEELTKDLKRKINSINNK